MLHVNCSCYFFAWQDTRFFFDYCRRVLLHHRLLEFCLDNWLGKSFLDNRLFEFLGYFRSSLLFINYLPSLLMNDRHVLLMNDFLVLLVDDWLMNLPYFLFVNYWLVVLVNNVLMMLMNHITVVLMDYILMVLVNYIPVVFFDDWLVNVLFYPSWLLNHVNLGWFYVHL